MKHLYVLTYCLFLWWPGIATAQRPKFQTIPDTLDFSFQKDLFIKPKPFQSRSLQRAVAIPILLTGAGLYSVTDNHWFSKYEVKEERDEWTPHFQHRLDDYLQFTPIVAVYGLNLAGVKGKNDFANRTAHFVQIGVDGSSIDLFTEKNNCRASSRHGPTNFLSLRAYSPGVRCCNVYGERVWASQRLVQHWSIHFGYRRRYHARLK